MKPRHNTEICLNLRMKGLISSTSKAFSITKKSRVDREKCLFLDQFRTFLYVKSNIKRSRMTSFVDLNVLIKISVSSSYIL